MRIAVAGAGFQGACVALELADRGYVVDLFDAGVSPLSRTAIGNEGKIHLSLVYAGDTSRRTPLVILDGALRFSTCLGRWIDFHADNANLSTPFYYGVHRDSQIDASGVRAHFCRVQSLYDDLRQATGLNYLFEDGREIWREVPGGPEAVGLDASRVSCVFETVERAVDPLPIAEKLRARINSEDRVTYIGETTVTSIRETRKSRLELTCRTNDVQRMACYDHVVNALWAGRMAIDEQILGAPRRDYILRNKVGIRARPGGIVPVVPSLTLMLGSFGDIVGYPDGSYYLSWYPSCMIARVRNESLDRWEDQLDGSRRQRVVSGTWSGLSAICPAVARVRGATLDSRLIGGTIVAWGATDIDDARSELHSRHDIGIVSRGRYHSIDTGKYTMAPKYAVDVADRIDG